MIKANVFNPGDRTPIASEDMVESITFRKHKFTTRPKPTDPSKITIYSCVNEFGCETVGIMYCLPRMMSREPGQYTIAIGWYGREYFYRHLVDEFWEIDEEFQWLREYCRAFHHESKNLSRLETSLSKEGKLVSAMNLGQLALGNCCLACGAFWGEISQSPTCNKCKSKNIEPSLFGNVSYWRKKVVRIPTPNADVLAKADSYLKPNSVGVFARGRKCYGRNLQPEFYVKLIELLEGMGYNPIWLGEKASTQACPVSHIVDFSRMPESRDLELTLAIISRVKFTVQYWTASTRLASMMGTPYLLFESPDQIWGQGQEGYRRKLCDFGPSKLVISHYKNTYEDNDAGLALTRQAIEEIQAGNFKELSGLVDKDVAMRMRANWRGK